MPGLLLVPATLEPDQLFAGVGQLTLELFQAVMGCRIVGLLQLHLLHFEAGDPPLQLVDLLGLRIQLHPQMGGGLVDQVDGLVGKLAAGDVPV